MIWVQACVEMTTTEKARIAAEIEAFDNTDFPDCPLLTEGPKKVEKRLVYLARLSFAPLDIAPREDI